MLQNLKLDKTFSIKALNNSKNNIVRIRFEEHFESFCTEAKKIASEADIEEAFSRSAIPQIRRMKGHFDYEAVVYDEPIKF